MKLLLAFVCMLCSATAIDFQCRDQKNNAVDWFVFYKIPRMQTSDNELIRNGVAFLYFDSNNKQWTLSDVGMDSKDQPVAHTLQQYYNNSDNPEVFSIMYSDQLPYPQNGTWSSYSGHCKGVTVFSKTSGFWLIHSVPKFPRNDTYDYPPNAHRYGQMGICVSLPYNALNDVASLPTSFASNNSLLAEIIAGHYQQNRPFANAAHFFSVRNHPFVHFAKAGQFGKESYNDRQLMPLQIRIGVGMSIPFCDFAFYEVRAGASLTRLIDWLEFGNNLYFDLVAPSLHVSLKTETWQHESGTSKNLHSWCRAPNPYQVFNVKSLYLPFNITFTNYLDHSKFAVATDTQGGLSDQWICISDINRQTHQMSRGGGSLCTADAKLYDAFSTIIAEYWPCKGSDL